MRRRFLLRCNLIIITLLKSGYANENWNLNTWKYIVNFVATNSRKEKQKKNSINTPYDFLRMLLCACFSFAAMCSRKVHARVENFNFL